ncbi:Slo1p [Lachancea thermotolerans CBS 6340]|uniref:KLTH0G13926p n=1 Tax=Lachancea thermotolerans (strain ATCC 56472 / CBS 6340 / NRRL Y-8284) TaxID=559295 RepID=C5DN39_LACTC|nr:KLTH0G13926p [Lachancea thermotolerans CBS 6340]CAR25200.1 KLTH0G13926p [Lachancea thermotolerans CBS 6340]
MNEESENLQEIPAETRESSVASNSASTKQDKTDLLAKTKLLRDTLQLLLEKSEEQKKVCEQLAHENRYLQDYVENLMSSGNVLDK